mmetsp:Transcript_75340/g.230462  ORF Transcript_75340/g.230462 Transcript_75340/m.230462 type:complete len:438 (-) Transcript_75340:254-1567(-)
MQIFQARRQIGDEAESPSVDISSNFAHARVRRHDQFAQAPRQTLSKFFPFAVREGFPTAVQAQGEGLELAHLPQPHVPQGVAVDAALAEVQVQRAQRPRQTKRILSILCRGTRPRPAGETRHLHDKLLQPSRHPLVHLLHESIVDVLERREHDLQDRGVHLLLQPRLNQELQGREARLQQPLLQDHLLGDVRHRLSGVVPRLRSQELLDSEMVKLHLLGFALPVAGGLEQAEVPADCVLVQIAQMRLAPQPLGPVHLDFRSVFQEPPDGHFLLGNVVRPRRRRARAGRLVEEHFRDEPEDLQRRDGPVQGPPPLQTASLQVLPEEVRHERAVPQVAPEAAHDLGGAPGEPLAANGAHDRGCDLAIDGVDFKMAELHLLHELPSDADFLRAGARRPLRHVDHVAALQRSGKLHLAHHAAHPELDVARRVLCAWLLQRP